MGDPMAVMCERHEREHGGEDARWKVRPLMDDTCHLCVMESENAALRKRVESQQSEINTLVVELGVARKRVEEAERERGWLAAGYERRRVELDAQYTEIKQLQSDLDAALLCLSYAADAEWLSSNDFEYPDICESWKRVTPLLEKRREQRG